MQELGLAQRVGLQIQFVVRVRLGGPAVRAGRSATDVYVLEVMSGPLDGKTWTFDHEITIGRDDAVATACITIDRYISRVHARLYDEDGGLRLVDLASRNGTRLDGNPLEGPAPLPLGHPFVVGRTTLRVTRDE